MSRAVRPTVIVIGAGVAGLAAARSLARVGVTVTVVERGDRVGGRLRTEMVDGLAVDVGAQFLTNSAGGSLELARQVGLADRLVGLRAAGAVLREGRLFPVWPDARMLRTKLLSPSAKLQILGVLGRALRHRRELDLHAPEKAHRLDTESVADFARRRLGPEVLDYAVEPLLESFLYWTPSGTSVAMLLLLVRTMMQTRQLFVMGSGLGALAQRMSEGLDVRTRSEALHVAPERRDGRYAVAVRTNQNETTLTADGLVCATTASRVPELFRGSTDPLPSLFASTRYVPCAVTVLAVARRLPARFFGLLFPRREARLLATAAVQSVRDVPSSPAGRDFLVLYPSGPASRELLPMGDESVRAALLADLRLAGSEYDAGPDERACLVFRWEEALPEFDVGYLRELHDFARSGFGWGRVAFAGDYLGGPSVEGALTSGRRAATAVLARLGR